MTQYTDTDELSREELCDRIYRLESALERIVTGQRNLSDQEMVEIAAWTLNCADGELPRPGSLADRLAKENV